MHHFAETNQEIPYSLFVSSKVKKNKKAPLIVTLHGIGGTHLTMMRPNAIDLAEAGGYILLAPMGYNPRGWYGAPPPQRRGGAPPAPPSTRGAAAVDAARCAPPQGRRGVASGSAERPERSAEPARAQREGNARSRRSDSQGIQGRRRPDIPDGALDGRAGALYLAIKYPQRWAAVAALAPAAFAVDREGLSKIPKMPIMLVHGDMDTSCR
jgi:poly(3-hydroxybutyrate) depolymerase